MMILQVLVTLVAILCCSNSAPVPDDGNPAECILETQPDSLSDYKIMSCMLENEIMVYMKDSDLLTFTTEQERQDCNCQDKTERFKYTSAPSHDITPHIRIDHLYKSYQSYRYPENTVDLDGNSFPVTTEWILKDYVNSLESFVEYFVSSELASSALVSSVMELNTTVLSRFDSFAFSSDCPTDNTKANFSTLSNATCELRCATWHFNDTIDGFNYAIANQMIYKTKTNSNKLPGIVTWSGQQCCPLLIEEHTLSPLEYRNLTCKVQSLFYDAHTLFQQLGTMATTECANATTVTGIKTWSSYYDNEGSFPPVKSCGYDDKLYIYTSHFDSLQKYSNDLSQLVADSTFNCFSPIANNTIILIKDTLDEVLPMTKHWMRGHGCPNCASACFSTEVTDEFFSLSHLHETCSEMTKEVSCLAYDLHSVATSLNMFLELRDEAKESWKYNCI